MVPHHPWAHPQHQQALRVPQAGPWCRAGAALSVIPLFGVLGLKVPGQPLGAESSLSLGLAHSCPPQHRTPGHLGTGQGPL